MTEVKVCINTTYTLGYQYNKTTLADTSGNNKRANTTTDLERVAI